MGGNCKGYVFNQAFLVLPTVYLYIRVQQFLESGSSPISTLSFPLLFLRITLVRAFLTNFHEWIVYEQR